MDLETTTYSKYEYELTTEWDTTIPDGINSIDP